MALGFLNTMFYEKRREKAERKTAKAGKADVLILARREFRTGAGAENHLGEGRGPMRDSESGAQRANRHIRRVLTAP
jgi:hypothetical protein